MERTFEKGAGESPVETGSKYWQFVLTDEHPTKTPPGLGVTLEAVFVYVLFPAAYLEVKRLTARRWCWQAL